MGLPPRGRGRVGVTGSGVRLLRITPAWAGKRRGGWRGATRPTDYPRVGGEELDLDTQEAMDAGLPPRGRGRVSRSRGGAGVAGITPAWAGKSSFSLLCLGMCRDYPRVGGEEEPLCACDLTAYGLPPRGRGRGGNVGGFTRSFGITPAWAGKSRFARGTLKRYRDYPRVGGEEFPCRRFMMTRIGLPPRGRGRGQHPLRHRIGNGITPAWAGKSASFAFDGGRL